MKKFLAYCSIVSKNTNGFLGERVVWLLIEVFPVFIMVSFWGNLESTGKITHLVAGQLILYYVIGFLINRLVSVHFEEWSIDNIKDGSISTYILRPMSYQAFLFANELMWRFTGMIQVIPVFVVLVPQLMRIHLPAVSWEPVALGVGLVVLSYFIRFFVSWLIAMAAFWIDQASALVHFKWMSEGFFGGQWLPLSFFPLAVRSFASWTPFYTWYFVPIQLFTGAMPLSEGLMYAARAVVWTFVLWGLSEFLWKRALQKYSAVGG